MGLKADKPKLSRFRGEVVLLVLYLVLTPLLLTPWIHGTDGVGYYVYIRSAVIDHDLNFTDAYAHYVKIFPYIRTPHDPSTGLIVNPYMVGTSVLWAPFFLIGHLFAYVFGYARDGYSAPYVVATCLGSSIYAFLAIVLAYRFSKRFFPPRESLLSAVGIWLASSLPYYMWLDPSMSHAASAFLVSAFLYSTCVWTPQRSYVKWVSVGLLLGLLGTTRPTDLGFIVVPILLNLSRFKELLQGKRVREHLVQSKLTTQMAFSIGLVAAVLPQLYAWRILYGTFFPSPSKLISISGSWTPDTVLLLPRVFLSPLHGLFYWTPTAGLGVIGAILMIRHKQMRMLGIGIVAAILIQAVVINGWSAWFAPASFGERFFLNATAPLILGLANFTNAVRSKLKSQLPNFLLISLLILWNVGLLIQYGTGIIGPDEPESLTAVAYNDLFIILPQLPLILTRFITTRMGHTQLSTRKLEQTIRENVFAILHR